MADDWKVADRLTTKKPWHDAFFKKLCETANVAAACRAARISKQTAYDDRKTYPLFAEAWDEAIEIAVELLELEARRRAEKGFLDPVYQGGVRVGTIRKYSDALLMFLLKAHRPLTYSDRKQFTGPNGGPIAFTGALATYELGAEEAGTIFDELASIGAFESALDGPEIDAVHSVPSDA